MRIWQDYRKLLADNKYWFKKTAVWAVFWFAVGFAAFMAHPQGLGRFIEFLRKMFEEIFQGRDLAIDARSVMLIFKNNFQASIVVLFGGIIAGLIPLLSIAFNLFVLGYLFAFLVSVKAEGLLIFAMTVLPHGIVELPLFLLAASFGLRLGFFWKINAPVSDWEKFKLCLKDNLKLVPLLALGFLLAAYLEIFVSGRLAEKYVNLIPPP